MKSKFFVVIKNILLIIIALICLNEMGFQLFINIFVVMPEDLKTTMIINAFGYQMFLIAGVIFTVVLSFIDYPWRFIERFLGIVHMLSIAIIFTLACLLYSELVSLNILSHACPTGFECAQKIQMAGFRALAIGLGTIIINNLRLSMKKHANSGTKH